MNVDLWTHRRRGAALVLVLGCAGPWLAMAADGSVMYRCPGNEYNNTLSPKEAKDRGCKTLEGAPITVIQSDRRPVPSAASAASGAGSRVDPGEQRARFEAEMDEKERVYGERYPIDEDFLAALAEMPEASGVALGCDRLVMLAVGARTLDDVIWTPAP